MQKFFIGVLFFIITTALVAQRPSGGAQGQKPKITLKGQIMSTYSGTPLEFATISIFDKENSELITGGLTDLDGTFQVEVEIGPIYAEIEFISFEKLIIDPIIIDREAIRSGDRVINLGTLEMNQNAELLDEVEITAEKSEMQFALDKRIFNVGKDLANQGGTAQDILDNVPSVTVDIEGNVSLRGSSGVRILIDGRPSGLAGEDNANGLRAIPANLIDKVEVITNPSARYEAEGMAGILNIVLKKQKGGGFNGSFDVSGGYPAQGGVGANINYRKGKVNWFANYGLNYRESPGSGMYYQTTQVGSDLFIQDQESERNRTGLSNSIRAGIDFFPTEKQTFTGSFIYRRSDEDNLSALTYQDYLNSVDNLTRTTLRTDDEREEESNLEYSINYKREFSNRKHVLNATLQFRDNVESENSDFFETVTFSSGSDVPDLIQRSGNDEGQKNILFQLDYVQPLEGENHNLELGLRTNFRDIDNDYLVEELQDGDFVSLPGLSNNFEYDEDVLAAYAMYGRGFGKLSLQAGLRAEYSHVITALLQTDEVNDRDYMNLFPSVNATYEMPKGNALQLSYSRRIRRPRFWDLNPFFTFSDSRNTFSGNPNLDPEYTDSYEIGNIKYFENATFGGSLFYRHTTDVIQRVLTFLPDGTTNRQPENLATQNDFGLEFTMQYSGVKWYRVDANANFFRSETNGNNVDDSFSAETFTWFARMTNRFKVWDGADLQVRLNYRAPRETVQGRSKSITSLDLGLSKDITSDATLTFGVRDLFNSRKRRGETIGENFYREDEFQWRARSFNLALNYRVNQKKRRGGGERGGDNQGGEQF